MNILNIEIKSSIDDPNRIASLLEKKQARFIGEDNQVDTYFQVKNGRLKLRQGNIENALVYYRRPESLELKRSEVKLQELPPENQELLKILEDMHGIKTVVSKIRKIYFIHNVKFHIDRIPELGSFVEIEANDMNGQYDEHYLKQQCNFYIDYLGLSRMDFIDKSYSDMVESKQQFLEGEKGRPFSQYFFRLIKLIGFSQGSSPIVKRIFNSQA